MRQPDEADDWAYVPDDLRVRYDDSLISIPNAVRVSAARHPAREAIVDGADRLTFAELAEAAVNGTRAMMALGVRPGDRVAVWAPNSVRWIVAALGVHGAGGVLVPVNTRFKGSEAAYLLKKSGASRLFVANGFLGNDYLEMLRGADPDAAVLQPGQTVLMSDTVVVDQLSWADWLSNGSRIRRDAAIVAIDAVRPDQLSDIMFTSGTTGYPKGVMLTHAQSLRAHGWLGKVMDFRPGDRYLIIPPFFHTFGYKAGWMACIVHGVTAVPLAAFSLERALAIIERERISILLGPPTVFQEILDSPYRSLRDLSSIRVVMASATAVSPELIARLRDDLNAQTIVSAYGLTEATSLITTTYPGVDTREAVENTVGRAAWDVQVRIVDEDFQRVAAGVPGELVCRGYNVMRGYWDDPEGTREAISADGWLRTGDIAVADESGFIRITDRKKDVILTGGFNVYPAEVERVLGQHPDVHSVAVVGAPDERLGEVPVAFVVGVDSTKPSPEVLRRWASDRLANFKVPRRVLYVSELPRNASAKVLKNVLREHARAVLSPTSDST